MVSRSRAIHRPSKSTLGEKVVWKKLFLLNDCLGIADQLANVEGTLVTIIVS
jgi:hypothetical protein